MPMYSLSLKKEKADGGVSYAMYFVGIVLCVVIYIFLKFQADLYMVEECLENGLHIAESRVLTVNHDKTDEEGRRGDTYERELSRMHIITKYSTNAAKSEIEERQVRILGSEFSEAVKRQLDLENTHPAGGILKTMCGSDADIGIYELFIYEPVYQRKVTDKNRKDLIEGSGGLYEYEFYTEYTPVLWIKYSLNFDPRTNEYESFSKEILSSVPELKNGNAAEGATLEATVTTNFRGIRNIFAGVNRNTPAIQKDAYHFGPGWGNAVADGVNMEGTEGAMFSDSPEREITDTVYVTQAVDIVVRQNDSRYVPGDH